MRTKMFVVKASCTLLSAFLICGKTAPVAYCQSLADGIAMAQPEMVGAFMTGLHLRSPVATGIMAPYVSAGKAANAARPQKSTEQMIIYIIKKNANRPPDTVEVKNSIADKPATGPSVAATKTVILPAGGNYNPGSEEYPGIPIDDEMDPLISKYAEMISMEPEDISNHPLYHFIDKWYGTRYKWGGDDRSGIDCSAFSKKLYGEIFGTELDRTSRQQHRHSEHIKYYADASQGDLIFFRIHRIRITHVGIYLANGYFVHASRSHGVMISSLNDKYWHRRYAGCGKVAKETRINAESDFME